MIPVKGLSSPKGVATHRLRTTGLIAYLFPRQWLCICDHSISEKNSVSQWIVIKKLMGDDDAFCYTQACPAVHWVRVSVVKRHHDHDSS